MELDKKTWEMPQLIILARGTPEESVLTHCKVINPAPGMTGATTNSQDGCNRSVGAKTDCGACQARPGGS